MGINCRTGCLKLNKDTSNQMYQSSALIGDYRSPIFCNGFKLTNPYLEYFLVLLRLGDLKFV